MPRYLKIAAAQMGPNQDGTPREAIVERMLALLDEAARDDVEGSRASPASRGRGARRRARGLL